MSIPVLGQVYDEVRRLSIAGSVVAAGDFRLKKLLPPLEQAGQKSPVFSKLAQAVGKLVEASEKTSAEALLELSTLVNAILYTQGETGLPGALEPIKTTDLGQQQTQLSARMLKPLFEALSTTGSGRMEVIKEAYERGAFRDLRLVGPAIAAIDDPYPEVADFIAHKVLPIYGSAIYATLSDRFDPKGRGGHVRRLVLMHQLDPDATREMVKKALEEGSKEVKVAAIECLGRSEEDLSFLLEQSAAKAKDVRTAALKALAKSNAGEAVQALCRALQSGDLEIAVEPIRACRNAHVLQFAIDEAKSQFAQLLSGKEKDKAKLGEHVTRMLLLLECLRGRNDKQTETFLIETFGQRSKLSLIKADPGGKDVEQRLVSIMANGPMKAQLLLVDAHASLPEDELAEAFVAACRSRNASEVFELFSPYVEAKVDEKKKRDPAFLKREAIVSVLIRRSHWRPHQNLEADDEDNKVSRRLDSRWLDLAAKHKHLELVQALAVPGHAAANKLLAQAFDDQLKKAKHVHELADILRTMVGVKHPAATDAVIASIEKHAKAPHTYGLSWIALLIPQLPKASLSRLEKMLPTLPDNVIDQILDYVTELKNQT